MKYILILACLLSSSVMAQEKLKLEGLTATGTGTVSDPKISEAYKAAIGTFAITPTIKNDWTISQTYSLQVNGNFKPMMSISDRKPDSTYHVWFDKKAITWTSDSTFILKAKER